MLNNTLLNIEPLDVLGVMDAIEAHYQKLVDFGKCCISKSIKCQEIQDKQTLRMFKDLLVRAAISLNRQGVVVSDTDLKAIYLYSGFLVYGVDGLAEISTAEVLPATKDPPTWRVHQITDWYSENLGDINTKLENSGHVRIPKADAKPMPLPGESCQTNEVCYVENKSRRALQQIQCRGGIPDIL